MIDFSKIEQYRENNRIEAKKALGGLPKSICLATLRSDRCFQLRFD